MTSCVPSLPAVITSHKRSGLPDNARSTCSVHDNEYPSEILPRVKVPTAPRDLIGLYDVVARLMSVALQYGAPLEKIGDLLAEAKFAPCGPMSGHDRIEYCSSFV